MKFLTIFILPLLFGLFGEKITNINNVTWRLIKIEDKKNNKIISWPMENWLIQDSPILTFNDSTYSGNGGCNAFFGRCEIDGKNIIINGWSTTTINCVGKRGEVENIIGNNFNNFHYFIKSDSLLLTNKDDITLTYIKSN